MGIMRPPSATTDSQFNLDLKLQGLVQTLALSRLTDEIEKRGVGKRMRREDVPSSTALEALPTNQDNTRRVTVECATVSELL